MEGWKPGVLQGLLGAVCTALAIAGLTRLLGRGAPASIAGPHGEIRPNRWVAGATLLLGPAFIALAFGGYIESPSRFSSVSVSSIAVGAALLFSFVLGIEATRASILAFMSCSAVAWNDQVVEGPGRMILLAVGHQRSKIAWKDITASGLNFAAYWYIEASDGQRIYWNLAYTGHGAFAQALLQRNPHLVLPTPW